MMRTPLSSLLNLRRLKVKKMAMSTAVGDSSRGFKILGIQQIAIGGLSKEKLSAFWTGALGIPKV
jgi:hypothetical protein